MKRKIVVMLLAVLLIAALVGGAVGKFVTTKTVTGKVTFTAKLAENVQLLEHKAVRNEDGSYTLSTTETTTGNTYELLPGLDIPKDPFIRITGKTPIAAYLFLIVDDNLGASGITYTLADCWQKVEKQTNVYVYSEKNAEGIWEAVSITTDQNEIKILKDDTVYVSQTLVDNLTNAKLIFSATLKEIGNAQSAADVYKR